jgi:hypothetical protein
MYLDYLILREKLYTIDTRTLLANYREGSHAIGYMFYNDDSKMLRRLSFDESYQLYLDIKSVLDTREHIPNKMESKLRRQLAAKKNKGGRRSHKKKGNGKIRKGHIRGFNR